MRRPIATATVLVFLALSLGACSAAPSSAPTMSGAPAAPASQRSAASDAASGSRGAGAPAAQESAARTSAQGGSAGSTFAESAIPRLDRMVISNVSITGTVDDAITAAREAERIATRYGGFVGSANVRDVESGREASLTLRVPGPNLQTALADIRALGTKIASETLSTEDVTEEYTDVDSNIRNLRATEERILSLQEKATRMEEILAFQRELTNIRGQIERLEGRRRVLENRTAYAVVTIRFTEPITVAPRQPWNLLDTATQAFSALTRVGQVLGTIAIWALVLGPLYLIPLFIAWLFLRHRPARPVAVETPPQ